MNFSSYDKKASKKILICGVLISLVSLMSACKTETKTEIIDYGVIKADKNLYNATINSIVSTDVYGRSFDEGDVASSDKKVGMFYFIWLGEHEEAGIFDVTKYNKTEEGRKALWSKLELVDDEYQIVQEYDDEGQPIEASPLHKFHYFSEPLYGYYCSDDPWVLARHIELLTMSGIDYISLDLTNMSIYEKNTRAVLEALLKYQNEGWRVPQVTSFLTGTTKSFNHPQRVLDFYNAFYTDPRYDSLWLRDDATGKPVISIDRPQYYADLSPLVTANLKIRNTIWPYDKEQTAYDDASWMDWQYPQRVYTNSDGTYMSVSVSQHVGGSFGVSCNPYVKNDSNVRTPVAEYYHYYDTGAATNYDSNRGRGWDYELNKNVKENAFKGTNLEAQWRNALDNEKSIDEVFVTGWNEWVAYKLPLNEIHGGTTKLDEYYGKYYNTVTFCDTCDEEFSRDIEMTKEGYGDNFYLQNMRLTREYKFASSKVRYAGEYVTESLKNLSWDKARTYLDFTNEVFARDFDRADHQERYINNTNRNDIESVKMSHDGNNLYLQIKTVNNIVIDNEQNNNMNVLLSVDGSELPSWEGYNFILNRNALTKGEGKTKLETIKTDGQFDFGDEAKECDYYLDGKTLSIAIPLSFLGIKDGQEFTIDFKVADGISEPNNIMNYYVDGDSAPIGRLNYRYNSEHY